MASKNKQQDSNVKLDEAPPSGYEESSIPDIDAWFRPFDGAIVHGRIRGRIVITDDRDQPRDVVLIQLDRPVKAVLDEEEVTAEAGQVLAVGVRAKLTEMLYYVEHKGMVWFKVLGKQKLRGGREMWTFDLRFKGKKSTQPIAATPRVAEDGNAPF
jgi:hypothetical protein